ncbi:hypothetical protein [Streptomyces finlayi]|nr:hypothetical protein [Streptomyces finlayi]
MKRVIDLIRNAIQSGDRTLRLIVLMGAGAACVITMGAVAAVTAKYVGWI